MARNVARKTKSNRSRSRFSKQNKRKQNKSQKRRRGRRMRGGNAPVTVDTSVPHNLKWSDPNTAAPAAAHNGGLYSGQQFTGPWGNVPVTPTTTEHINNNLRSANPPPGATEQYIGTNRLGNNFVSMPGVAKFTSTHPQNPGPFDINCTTGGRRRRRHRSRSSNKKRKSRSNKRRRSRK
jgi:hypothetical protein